MNTKTFRRRIDPPDRVKSRQRMEAAALMHAHVIEAVKHAKEGLEYADPLPDRIVQSLRAGTAVMERLSAYLANYSQTGNCHTWKSESSARNDTLENLSKT